jgi:hypothetical protein
VFLQFTPSLNLTTLFSHQKWYTSFSLFTNKTTKNGFSKHVSNSVLFHSFLPSTVLPSSIHSFDVSNSALFHSLLQTIHFLFQISLTLSQGKLIDSPIFPSVSNCLFWGFRIVNCFRVSELGINLDFRIYASLENCSVCMWVSELGKL